MAQRPSLLDEGDFGAIGASRVSAPSRERGGRALRLGAIAALLAAAALVWLRPWQWGAASSGPTVQAVETEAQRQEFQREMERIQVDIERGIVTTNGA